MKMEDCQDGTLPFDKRQITKDKFYETPFG